jgi:hypothetical protein
LLARKSEVTGQEASKSATGFTRAVRPDEDGASVPGIQT